MTKANISMQKEGNSMMHFSLLGSQLLEISDRSALYIQTTWAGWKDNSCSSNTKTFETNIFGKKTLL